MTGAFWNVNITLSAITAKMVTTLAFKALVVLSYDANVRRFALGSSGIDLEIRFALFALLVLVLSAFGNVIGVADRFVRA